MYQREYLLPYSHRLRHCVMIGSFDHFAFEVNFLQARCLPTLFKILLPPTAYQRIRLRKVRPDSGSFTAVPLPLQFCQSISTGSIISTHTPFAPIALPKTLQCLAVRTNRVLREHEIDSQAGELF